MMGYGRAQITLTRSHALQAVGMTAAGLPPQQHDMSNMLKTLHMLLQCCVMSDASLNL